MGGMGIMGEMREMQEGEKQNAARIFAVFRTSLSWAVFIMLAQRAVSLPLRIHRISYSFSIPLACLPFFPISPIPLTLQIPGANNRRFGKTWLAFGWGCAAGRSQPGINPGHRLLFPGWAATLLRL
jgi:hypothetical protein